jgi:hypothetical protein
MKATILEEIKKQTNTVKPEMKAVWILPIIKTPVIDQSPGIRDESAPTKVNLRIGLPGLVQGKGFHHQIEEFEIIPIPVGPNISLQVGTFTKRSEATRAQRKISKKFNREVKVVQNYEYFILVIPGFKTRLETFPFYPELAGMGFQKISLVEKR